MKNIFAIAALTLSAGNVNGFQMTSRSALNVMAPMAQQTRFSTSSYSPAPLKHQSKSSLKMASDYTFSSNTTSTSKEKVPFPIVLWRFTRPHTLIGSALAIPALHILAAPTYSQAFTKAAATSNLFAMLPSLLMNLYITGLNQITDVEIDKINKPKLPIAAGDLSPKSANIIVTLSLIASLLLGVSHPVLGSQGLNVALWGSMILGTMYSLKPFRLKRFPLLAAFCIVSVRGAVINAGFFAHAMSAAYGNPMGVLACLQNDMKCFLSSLFFAVFGIVIALMKDVPDAVGDAQFNIRSFTVRIGQKNVFTAMRRLLSILFIGVGSGFTKMAIEAFTLNNTGLSMCRSIVALSAFFAGYSVREEAKDVNAEDSGEVYNYYMHLWKLFYASYLVLPFAR